MAVKGEHERRPLISGTRWFILSFEVDEIVIEHLGTPFDHFNSIRMLPQLRCVHAVGRNLSSQAIMTWCSIITTGTSWRKTVGCARAASVLRTL